MGSVLKAWCSSCGYGVKGLFAGGGMGNFRTFCGAPALCRECKAVHALNYLDPESKCPDCGSAVTYYNDPELSSPSAQEAQDARLVFDWYPPGMPEPLNLYDFAYLCPHCGEMEMRFEEDFKWD